MDNSGISGDIFLAALLRLTSDPDIILNHLKELKKYLKGVQNLNINLNKSEYSGIQLNKLDIMIKETKNHRTSKVLKNSMIDFLNNLAISDSAKNFANNTLETLINAEVEVHGSLDNIIHLHELSSVDTLIDISGVALCLDNIGYFKEDFITFCSRIPLGGGSINTAHGLLSVPTPATSKILEQSHIPVYGGPIDSELVTPTGAALLLNLNPQFSIYIPEMDLFKLIYSTGQKEFKDFSNIFRLFYGKTTPEIIGTADHKLKKYVEDITVLETDVDDVSGENLGYFIQEIQNEKILDIQVLPSITKKNRPGQVIRILSYPKDAFNIIEKIINELGTLGVRYHTIKRICVDRKIIKTNIEVNNNKYDLQYKIAYIDTNDMKKIVNIKPEYEDLKKISKISGVSLKDIQTIAQIKLKDLMDNV